jgi:hypothetical protein
MNIASLAHSVNVALHNAYVLPLRLPQLAGGTFWPVRPSTKLITKLTFFIEKKLPIADTPPYDLERDH